MLEEEAKQIHGEKFSKIPGDLNQRLYGVGSAALCLSGGGIRSAAFALGVIQALATHPRPSEQGHVVQAKQSLLAQFDYLSTVSGGGFIGSWLSAWIHRTRFCTVWAALIRASQRSGEEAPPIAWLRSYSNYLTPKLGLMSADTWTAGALFVRNMVLNWLVIIPPLCAVLLIIKLFALAMFAINHLSRTEVSLTIGGLPPSWGVQVSDFTLLFLICGVVALIFGLQSALVNRPTYFDEMLYRKQRNSEFQKKLENIYNDASSDFMMRQRNEEEGPNPWRK